MRPRALLSLLQVSDSAFPTGAFAHSLGLEAFYEAGELAGPEDLERAVGLHLDAAATSDCVALRASYAAASIEKLTRIDRLLSATKLTRELRTASGTTGRRFLASVGALNLEGGGLLGRVLWSGAGRRVTRATWPSATGSWRRTLVSSPKKYCTLTSIRRLRRWSPPGRSSSRSGAASPSGCSTN